MMKMPKPADPIPHDLAIEVLTILPAESLMRFKCVSKLWRSTISDPSFIRTHHSRSLTRPDGSGSGFLISFPKLNSSEQQFYDVNHKGKSSRHVLTLKVLHNEYLTQVVNGLVCFRDANRLSVCNISTREVLTLPVTSINVNVNVFCVPNYYFGFDSDNEEYKLLNMCTICTRSPDDSSRRITTFVQWEILNLGANSWRKIDDAPFIFDTPSRFNAAQSVFIDRFIFWLQCIDKHSLSLVVGAFDVVDEQFHIIPVPENGPDDIQVIRPVQIGKHLALAAVTDRLRSPVNPLKLWILSDPYKHTWIESCIHFPPDVFQRQCVLPAAQFRSGEILFTPLKLSLPIPVVNYDEIKNHWTTVEIDDIPLSEFLLGDQPRSDVHITPYVENIWPLQNHL